MSVAQSSPTLCDPRDCSPPGSSVHGVLQGRILEWVDFPFSRESSQPRDQTQVSCIAGRFFTSWAAREAQGLVACQGLWGPGPMPGEANREDLRFYLSFNPQPSGQQREQVVTQSKACYFPHLLLKRADSKILLGREAGHKTDSS